VDLLVSRETIPVQKLLEDMDGKYLDKKESMSKNSRV
jgi:hypothetical protein